MDIAYPYGVELPEKSKALCPGRGVPNLCSDAMRPSRAFRTGASWLPSRISLPTSRSIFTRPWNGCYQMLSRSKLTIATCTRCMPGCLGMLSRPRCPPGFIGSASGNKETIAVIINLLSYINKMVHVLNVLIAHLRGKDHKLFKKINVRSIIITYLVISMFIKRL